MTPTPSTTQVQTPTTYGSTPADGGYGTWLHDLEPQPIKMFASDSPDMALFEVFRGVVVLALVPGKDFRKQLRILIQPGTALHLERRLAEVLETGTHASAARIFDLAGTTSRRSSPDAGQPYQLSLIRDQQKTWCLAVQAGAYSQTFSLPTNGFRNVTLDQQPITDEQSSYIALELFRRWLRSAFPLLSARQYPPSTPVAAPAPQAQPATAPPTPATPKDLFDD